MTQRRKDSPHSAGHYHIADVYPYRLRISIAGTEVAVTTNAIILKEVGKSVYNPSFYIPREDVKVEYFRREDGYTTMCPIKGDASYLAFIGNPSTIERAAWSYETPLDYSSMIAGHIGFDQRYATIEISPVDA